MTFLKVTKFTKIIKGFNKIYLNLRLNKSEKLNIWRSNPLKKTHLFIRGVQKGDVGGADKPVHATELNDYIRCLKLNLTDIMT